jgi:L,D-transpeptidase ErfK/SrfK
LKNNSKNQDLNDSSEYRPEDTERRLGLALFLGLFTGVILAFLVFLYAPIFRDYVYWLIPETKSLFVDKEADSSLFNKELAKAEKRLDGLGKKITGLQPKDNYIIVDTSGNEIFLMKGDSVLHKGTCSTGKYVLLKVSKKKEYVFKTPRGQFRVQNKQKNPVWYKPDWAFIEEALPIPPRDSPDRFEDNVLGDYALAIGNGYLIHGTLYKRFLGMAVTHGCVRLDDETLEIMYKGMQTGGKVFIY